MNVFWKTIIMAVVTMAAIVSARFSAQWVHHNIIRSPNAQVRIEPPPIAVERVPQSAYAKPQVSYLPATSNFAAARTAPKPPSPPKPYKPYQPPRTTVVYQN
jgi:hypothetical protein